MCFSCFEAEVNKLNQTNKPNNSEKQLLLHELIQENKIQFTEFSISFRFNRIASWSKWVVENYRATKGIWSVLNCLGWKIDCLTNDLRVENFVYHSHSRLYCWLACFPFIDLWIYRFQCVWYGVVVCVHVNFSSIESSSSFNCVIEIDGML